MRTAECLCGCEGSGDPPFLLACPLPPFSQPSPCFPAGNRWGGQVTRANTSPVGPWRNGSRHSGEFLAGQDSRAVYFASRGRKGPFMQISQLVTVGCRPASCPVEPPPPHCGSCSLSSGPSRVQGSLSGSPGIQEDPEPGPRFPNSLRSQSWFSASGSTSCPHLGLGSPVSSFPQSVRRRVWRN